MLPENWAEYEDDENLNAFFDTSNWTGNLRVSVIEVDKIIEENYIEDAFKSHSKAKKFITQNGLNGIEYSLKSEEGLMYYWQLFYNNKIIVCSFVLNPKNDIMLNEKEVEKVDGIVSSIKVLQQ